MFLAINNCGNVVTIDDAIKNPKEKYYCLECKEEIIVKNGKKNTNHFAHKKNIR